MSESSPIKDALYANIDDVGQERIHKLMLNDKFAELFVEELLKLGAKNVVEKTLNVFFRNFLLEFIIGSINH